MKELLEFLKSNNGALYYDKDTDCFVLISEHSIKFDKSTAHCPFKGCDDAGVIPEDAGPEWIEPAIITMERDS